MLLFCIIIQFIGCFSIIFESPNIIQFEEYTNLICSLNQNYTFKNYIYSWWKNSKLLIGYNKNNIINTKSFDKKKYSSFILNNKFILQIKNVNNNEIKDKFECAISIHNSCWGKYNKFPKLNSLNITNSLSSDNINIKYINSTEININFKKIYPIPKCFIQINNKFIFPKNIIQNKKLDFLYSQVNLSMKILCFDKIICTLLNQNFIIKTYNNTCTYENLIIISSTNLVIGIVILFLISSIILSIFIYFKIKNII